MSGDAGEMIPEERLEMIPRERAEADVTLLARRLAMLFYHFSRCIIEELGEERGREVIRRAVAGYGEECGSLTRADVEALGKPATLQNHHLGRDLPSLGWVSSLVSAPGEPPLRRVERCPLAEYFFERGDPGLGRLYCYVDQAKFRAYNPRLKCEHVRNVLDGDLCCEIRVTEG